jgi:hypothetical protein
MIGLRTVLTLAYLLAGTTSAQAQGGAVRAGELTVAGGVVAAAGYAVGDRVAELRRGSGTDGLPLFRAESAFDAAPGLDLRVGYAITPWLTIEATGSIARPQLAVNITGDTEALAQVEVAERVSTYTVGASGVVYLPYRVGTKGRTYVSGGVEYLRQLHEDRLLAETGHLVSTGGGLRYWFRGTPGSRRAAGVRGETTLVFRSGGVDFDDRSRRYVRLSALAFFAF